MISQFILIIVLISLNAFFAMCEIAVVSVKKSKIAVLKNKGDKRAKLLLETIKNPSKFFATIQVGITLAGFFASAQAAVKIAKYIQIPLESIFESAKSAYDVSVIIMTIIISYITLVFGELVPKRLANTYPNEIALRVIKIIKIIEKILLPFIFILTKSTEFVVKITGLKKRENDEDISQEDIKIMANMGFKRGILNLYEKNFINKIFNFDDIMVKDIITKKENVFSICLEEHDKKIKKKFSNITYSRIPVLSNKEEVIGILYVKDLFLEIFKGKEIDKNLIKSTMRKADFTYSDAKIDKLFSKLKKNKKHISIVLDKANRYIGIVTMEDLLEQLVGEIYDEHD